MFSLIQGAWKTLTEVPQRKVLLLGLDGSGKTSLMEQLKLIYAGMEPLPASKVAPTVGLNIAKFQLKKISYIVWDVGGSASLRTLWDRYLSEADGILWVLDAGDGARADEALETLLEILARDEVKGKPTLIAANKEDEEDGYDLDKFAKSCFESLQGRDWKMCRCSALEGDGVKEGFDWLAEALANIEEKESD
ncbi:hypothetical protein NDN08_006681 [Rhodosorus marinus]|uniref:Uncharacterized protein n=1 Tax=Rhodosorus marinus TaxID=101924 RepID=A0AAV8UJS3_9RHOD|nr:hypothetical protein NDN08_006681 [Rhodosorus marinus]